MIRGVITGKDVVANLGTILHGFGWTVLFRCVVVLALHRQTTFLEIAFR